MSDFIDIKKIEAHVDEISNLCGSLADFLTTQETISSENRIIDKTQYTMLRVQQQIMESYAYIMVAYIEYDKNKK